jgi:hypothetical protein
VLTYPTPPFLDVLGMPYPSLALEVFKLLVIYKRHKCLPLRLGHIIGQHHEGAGRVHMAVLEEIGAQGDRSAILAPHLYLGMEIGSWGSAMLMFITSALAPPWTGPLLAPSC